MPARAPIYSDAQRGAVESCAMAHPELTAPEIARRAAAGELTWDGEPVDAFTIPATYVRSLRTRGRKRQEKEQRSALIALPPRDAVELLRRELLTIVDAKVKRAKRSVRRPGKHDVSGEELRQLARAVREIAAIPGPEGKSAQAEKPGPRAANKRTENATRDGLAGAITSALRPRGLDPAPETVQGDTLPITHEHGEHAATAHDGERINAADGEDPGSFARERIAALRAAPGAGET